VAKVLVTGATGFVGRHAITRLREQGHDVYTVGSRPMDRALPGVTHHQADLLDKEQLQRVIAVVQADHLLHFAWFVKPGEYLNSFNNIRWVNATLEMLRLFEENGGARAVLAGTCFEYDLQRGFLTEDVTPTRPDSLYGTCKNALRQMVEGYSEQSGLSTAWGRIFFLYGPHEYPGRLVASVINAVLRGEDANCSHGLQVRDFMHVQDVADAFVALLGSDVTGSVNIASGQPVSIGDVARKIASQAGHVDQVKLGVYSAPENEPPVILGDTRKLNNVVGWKPSISLDDGLARTIDWWKAKLAGNPD
jgi:nucleoside-diphosphate-sugar epimerase